MSFFCFYKNNIFWVTEQKQRIRILNRFCNFGPKVSSQLVYFSEFMFAVNGPRSHFVRLLSLLSLKFRFQPFSKGGGVGVSVGPFSKKLQEVDVLSSSSRWHPLR